MSYFVPTGAIIYVIVDRYGRKSITRYFHRNKPMVNVFGCNFLENYECQPIGCMATLPYIGLI